MTISFMVLGAPRSATTWMANLLTTDHTLCLHDPLLEYTRANLERIQVPGKKIGMACTGSLMFPKWLLSHTAKKVILFREPAEIDRSLRRLGLPPMEGVRYAAGVDAVKAKIFQWDTVFKPHVAREICGILDVPFDIYRFQELIKMNIQPAWATLPVDPEAIQALAKRVTEARDS